MVETIPGHYSNEKNLAAGVMAVGAFTALLLLIHAVLLGPIISYIFIVDINQGNWSVVERAFSNFYNFKQAISGIEYAYNLDPVITISSMFLLVAAAISPIVVAFAMNPYRSFDLIHGDARKGSMADIRKMEDRKQVGIRGGKFLHLGMWPSTGEPMRLIETLSCLVLAPPGTGKCLAPHEHVLLYDGEIKKTGDLKVGDLLMGPDGKPRKVVATNPGFGPMYRITPIKGRSFECNGDHVLSLRCSKKPRNRSVKPKKDSLQSVTVSDWMGTSQEQKGKWKQWRASVDFPKKSPLKLDPYFVGLLLGDGTTTAKIGIHTADPEIADHAYRVAAEYGLKVREEYQENNKSIFYAISAGNQKGLPRAGKNPLRNLIFNEGLRSTCSEKSIPIEYKTSSRDERLAILAGLLDTDGNYDRKNNVFDFVSQSSQLTEDVAFIARSLGFSAYPLSCEKTCVNNEKTKIYHRVCISGDVDIIPTKVERKKARPRRQIKNVTNTGFEIEAIGDGDYFGIILASIDPEYDHIASKDTPADQHLYLLDDFTVTHNTASFVVPSILDTPESSFIVNDPKPELFDLTSGYRAQIGHVFMINWSATDKVDPSNIDDPEKTIFYPRFNPLSPKLLPPSGTAERDTYLDAVANVMSPSSGKGGNSDYFEQKGRAALVGFLHYICSKIADAEPGLIDMTNIPQNMIQPDMEPSIPMLIDMINEGLRTASVKNDEEKEKAAQENRFYQGDALSDWLKGIVHECKVNGYNPRALTEITPLVSMAPNERSGILGTMDKAFLPFKNAAVRERTSSCDFVPADLRGMPDEHGIMRPVTLYVSVNQAEAAAFATITSLLYEILSREYLAYGPGEINRNGTKLGPFPVCFMLDEFAKLPRIEAVMTGPDLGRSKKTMYCLVAQSDAQIGKLYSKEDQQIIYATTAIKYILPQNDKDTIKLVQDMVGPTTIKRSSRSKSKGGDLKEWGKSNESTNLEKVDFIRAGDISGMQPGTHIIMAQGFMNRPYFMKSVFFFKDPEMLAKVYNPRTNVGPKSAYPIPERVRLARVEEWKKNHASQVKDGKTKKLVIELEKYDDIEESITA